MDIIVAADKFKGSLTSFEANESIRIGVETVFPAASIFCFPMADGGDGFAAVMKHYLRSETIACKVTDPLGRPMMASYEWQPATQTAIMEIAAASGLSLLTVAERDPLHASTLGTGMLITHAIASGANKIVLGLGGSATNDAGTGILQALGFSFIDAQGDSLPPCGASLSKIAAVLPPAKLPAVVFHVACDVTNPLYGKDGAAWVYAHQKGATEAQVDELDKGVQHYAKLIEDQTGMQVAQTPGSGAAGGILASLMPWFETTLASGADLVLKASGLPEALPQASHLVTGEGKLDDQSMQGKLIDKLLRVAQSHGVPVSVICGKTEMDEQQWREAGFFAVRNICAEPYDTTYCMQHASSLIQQQAYLLAQQFNS
jgi:glycerate kinase